MVHACKLFAEAYRNAINTRNMVTGWADVFVHLYSSWCKVVYNWHLENGGRRNATVDV